MSSIFYKINLCYDFTSACKMIVTTESNTFASSWFLKSDIRRSCLCSFMKSSRASVLKKVQLWTPPTLWNNKFNETALKEPDVYKF